MSPPEIKSKILTRFNELEGPPEIKSKVLTRFNELEGTMEKYVRSKYIFKNSC